MNSAKSILVVWAICVGSPCVAWCQKPTVDFATSIQPLLQASCYSCHGSDAQEGGLRLDHRRSGLAGGDAGRVIVANKPEESLLLTLVAGFDKERGRMPPEGEGKPLSKKQVELIRRWIQQGAVWPESADNPTRSEHWAYQPIGPVELPEVQDKNWQRTPIDRFILAEMEKRGMTPSPVADRGTLIRRIYLDTLGLLPPPQVVLDFLNDQRPDAYRIAVDQVLKSPHYGERWGRHWLDLARYADSDGYEKDRPRPHAWRYRQWVIDALNADMPFDQFSIEQLAGDMLPGEETSTRVATGFHRNTLHNTEGGTDQEEDRVKKTVDRTNTFGSVWLGLTVGCAQCHSHKYDAISQREYYQLYSFFNGINEQDISAPTPEQQIEFDAAIAAFDTEHASYLEAIDSYEQKQLPIAFEKWLKEGATKVHRWNSPDELTISSKHGATFKQLDDGSWLSEGTNQGADTYTLQTTVPSANGFRLEVLPDDQLPQKGPGRADNGNFVLTTVTVESRPAGTDGEFQPVPITRAAADFSQKDWDISKAVNENPDDGWAVSPEIGKRHVALFQFANKLLSEGGVDLRIQLVQKYDPKRPHNIGRFRVTTTGFEGELDLEGTPEPIVAALVVPTDTRNDAQQKTLLDYFKKRDSQYLQLQKSEREHKSQSPALPPTKAQSVVEVAPVRQAHIHLRGNFLSKGDAVETRGFDTLPEVEKRGELPDRLDLAKWTMSANNPLTARVTVNRIWQRYFGTGIVETSDDFGKQGTPPSHPELLDWLAHEFRSQGWSLKHLHRLILNSSVYRQESARRPETAQQDPDNIWLTRQYRGRVEAEIIRDLALDASGLLSRKRGGPSVRPPQPSEYAALTYANSAKWSPSTGEDRFRRGLYTFFQRTSPYPMLMTFDSPDSTQCTTQRSRSNTPMQALTLWNDTVFTECAQHLGRRVMQDVPAVDDAAELLRQRIDYLFVVCLARHPKRTEFHAVETYYQQQVSQAEQDEELAKQIVGDQPRAKTDSIAEAAGWVALSRVMLNLDEFITKE